MSLSYYSWRIGEFKGPSSLVAALVSIYCAVPAYQKPTYKWNFNLVLTLPILQLRSYR
jgi:hypothetical protein